MSARSEISSLQLGDVDVFSITFVPKILETWWLSTYFEKQWFAGEKFPAPKFAVFSVRKNWDHLGPSFRVRPMVIGCFPNPENDIPKNVFSNSTYPPTRVGCLKAWTWRNSGKFKSNHHESLHFLWTPVNSLSQIPQNDSVKSVFLPQGIVFTYSTNWIDLYQEPCRLVWCYGGMRIRFTVVSPLGMDDGRLGMG